MPACIVLVIDSAGGRHTMTVEAESLYAAVFAYNHQQICGQHRHFPKLQRDTAIEVRAPDGRTFRTTYGNALDWANRQTK